jgi:hypothetical protein
MSCVSESPAAPPGFFALGAVFPAAGRGFDPRLFKDLRLFKEGGLPI